MLAVREVDVIDIADDKQMSQSKLVCMPPPPHIGHQKLFGGLSRAHHYHK